jgi:hypothetical protein
MNQNHATQLQTLLDRQQIETILTTYPRAIDRLDLELLKSLYHPDARDDHASFRGTAHEFADYVIPVLQETFTATMHHVTHYNIELNGDIAAAESYYYAYHRLEGGFDKIAGFFGPSYARPRIYLRRPLCRSVHQAARSMAHRGARNYRGMETFSPRHPWRRRLRHRGHRGSPRTRQNRYRLSLFCPRKTQLIRKLTCLQSI